MATKLTLKISRTRHGFHWRLYHGNANIIANPGPQGYRRSGDMLDVLVRFLPKAVINAAVDRYNASEDLRWGQRPVRHV